MNSGIELKRYPYCGDSHNLIECFIIVGFDHTFIPEHILKPIEEISVNNQKPKNADVKIFEEFKISEKPTILSCISSDYKKDIFPLNEVLNFCFPSPPPIYHTDDDPSNTIQYDPLVNNNNIIFQNNSIDGNEKITFNVYAYIFYENFVLKNKHKVFIPKAFLTISQYPLFNLFKNLSAEIHKQFTLPALEIPMEIQIYNILNFIPAPVNMNENYILLPKQELNEYVRKKEEKEFLQLEQLRIEGNQLTGYPYFDINICEVLNVLPFEGIVEAFILTFLEKQVNVYCKTIEILNLTMLIITSFNFPFDTPYNWQIASVGKEETIDHTDSKLVGKPTPSILGFNFGYTNEVENYLNDTPSHFSIDLDNKFISYVGENSEDDENIRKITYYLEDLINNQKGNGMLEKIIINLVIKLRDISNKLSYNAGNKIGFEFFNIEPSKLNLNKIIQDAFYDFYIDILCFIYPLYSLEKLDQPDSNGKYYKVVRKDFKNVDEVIPGLKSEEKLFLKILGDTLKVDSFSQFIEYTTPIPIFLSHYIFAENFLILKKLYNNNTNNTPLNFSYMNIIDKLYKKKKDKNATYIHFQKFFIYYKENLTKIMGDYINSEHIEKTITPKKISYKYTRCELDNSIVVKYMHILNELNEIQLQEIFPSLLKKNSPTFHDLKEDDIPNTIEAFYIENKIIDYKELVKTCLLIIFTTMTEKISVENFKNIIIEILSTINFSLRKYVQKIIFTYYNVCSNQIKNGNYSLLLKMNCYIELFNILNQRGILPNESLVNLISQIITLYENEKEDIKLFKEEQNKINGFYKSIESKDNTTLYKLNVEGLNNENSKETLKLAENTSYDGTIKENEVKLHFTSDLLSYNRDFKSLIFSPLKLFKNCNKLYSQFIHYFDRKVIESNNDFREVILNLLFYTQNIPELNSKLLPKFFLVCLFSE